MTVLDQLIANPPTGVNNTFVNVDGEYGAQCWDIVELYAEKLGVPKQPWAITLNSDGVAPAGSAKNAWLYFSHNPNLVAHFDKIPKGQQKRGDINIYDGHGIYTEGHINIDLGNGQVFEQNADPDHSPAHISARSTTYLLGSIRLKGVDMSKQAVTLTELDLIYLVALHMHVDAKGKANVGRPFVDVLNTIKNSPRWKNQNDAVKNYDAVKAELAALQAPTPLSSGIYKVN